METSLVRGFSRMVDTDFEDLEGRRVQRGHGCCRWYTLHTEELHGLGQGAQCKENYATHEILLQLRSASLPFSIGIAIPCLNN